MEINIKIEGLNQLTESLALLASAIAYKNGMEKTEGAATEGAATEITREPYAKQAVAQVVEIEGHLSVEDQVKKALKIAKKEKVVEVVEEKVEEIEKIEKIVSETSITIEEVRAAFMAKNSKGNTPKLKDILKEFNVAKVTDLEEVHFEGVLARLEAI